MMMTTIKIEEGYFLLLEKKMQCFENHHKSLIWKNKTENAFQV